MKTSFLQHISRLFRARIIMFVLIGILSILLCIQIVYPSIEIVREKITLAHSPSGILAFDYGERHFSSKNPREYNIDAAEYFFEQAAHLNPDILYLHHQRARIAFLRGDYGTALQEINIQIELHGTSTPNSYYVRGLIEGFVGDYIDAASDYEEFLVFDPKDWAAINDYAWVLLKSGRSEDAVKVTNEGLLLFPTNAWLLNSNAIALYEIHDIVHARLQAQRAIVAVDALTDEQWSYAYPGNDPAIAHDGLNAFKLSTRTNLSATLLSTTTSARVQ